MMQHPTNGVIIIKGHANALVEPGPQHTVELVTAGDVRRETWETHEVFVMLLTGCDSVWHGRKRNFRIL